MRFHDLEENDDLQFCNVFGSVGRVGVYCDGLTMMINGIPKDQADSRFQVIEAHNHTALVFAVLQIQEEAEAAHRMLEALVRRHVPEQAIPCTIRDDDAL